MKETTWNVLTAIVFGAFLLAAYLFISIFTNPQTAMNPFPPPVLPTALSLPTATETQRALPPTWTPTGPAGMQAANTQDLRPSSTPLPTSTGFVLPTFTPTFTITPTPTETPTTTNTPTETKAPTATKRPPTNTPKPTLTNTPVPPTEVPTATEEVLPTQP